MNCNDIERILDDGDVAALAAPERAAVTAHLEACRDCALEWEVHAQFVTAESLAVPDTLVARCKAGFVAAARSTGRSRSRARPFVLLGLCVGAAAAALVGAELVDIGGSRSDDLPAAAAAAVDDASASDTERSVAGGAATIATESMMAQGATAASASTAVASSPGSFVLAVSALHADVIDSGARSIAESIHAELLRQLRALPYITVVETEFVPLGEPISVIYGAAAGPDAGGDDMWPAADVRSGEVVDPSTPDIDVMAGIVPDTLRARMAALTGTTGIYPAAGNDGAQTWAVNVVLDGNLPYLNAASMPGAIVPADGGTDGGRASSFDMDSRSGADIDYRLDIEATSVRKNNAINEWILAIRGSGVERPGGHNFDFTATGSTSRPVDARSTAERVVENLRRAVLPANTRLLEDLQTRVLDSRLSLAERLQALDELKQIRQRTDVEGRNDDVVRAMSELASAATASFDRRRLWQAVRGVKNENLVGPLVDALRYDADEDVRLEAVRTLAADFIDNPSVRVALEQASYTDGSAAIRLEATWAVRDAAARKSYVRATLLDASLSGDERTAPLLFALNEEAVARAQEYASVFAAGGEQAVVGIASEYADAIDDSAAQALIEILQGIADESRKFTLVLQLARIPHPTLTRFNLETLRGDAHERARANAAVALGPRVSEPDVRPGLEYALSADPSPLVRDAARRSLSAR